MVLTNWIRELKKKERVRGERKTGLYFDDKLERERKVKFGMFEEVFVVVGALSFGGLSIPDESEIITENELVKRLPFFSFSFHVQHNFCLKPLASSSCSFSSWKSETFLKGEIRSTVNK